MRSSNLPGFTAEASIGNRGLHPTTGLIFDVGAFDDVRPALCTRTAFLEYLTICDDIFDGDYWCYRAALENCKADR